MLNTLGITYGTQAMLDVFSDRHFARAVLRLECALLQVQADMGIIPKAEAMRLAALDPADINLAQAAELSLASGNPAIGIIEQLYPVSRYAHYGITAQDAWDTAHVLQLQNATALLMAQIRCNIIILCTLAGQHESTPMVARTQGQLGAPQTFGFKVAGWLDELLRIAGRLRRAAAEAAVLTIGGSVGTGSAFQVMGADPREVERRVARILDLQCTLTPIGISRDRFTALGSTLGQFCTLAARIGHEVYSAQRSGIGELAEGGAAGSSAVPQKINPWIAQRMRGFGGIARGLVPIAASGASLVEGERELGSVHAEWYGLVHLFLISARLAQDLHTLTANLEVHSATMKENLAANPAVLSESLSILLGRKVGKPEALRMMKQAVADYRQGACFRETVLQVFKEAGVAPPPAHLLETGETGWSVPAVRKVIEDAESWLAENDMPQDTQRFSATPDPTSR